jgi:hypothetical protein
MQKFVRFLSHAALFTLPLTSPVALAFQLDHAEFDATLQVPFRAAAGKLNEARNFTLNFEFPGAAQAQAAAWRLQLISPQGKVLQTWYGIDPLQNKALVKTIAWAGRNSAAQVPDGLYQVQMEAVALDANPALLAGTPSATVPALLGRTDAEVIKQAWPMQIGKLASVSTPAFNALPGAAKALSSQRLTSLTAPNGVAPSLAPAPAPASLPYSVFYGNLHSQTNHSDGGGDVNGCDHAQKPQSGAYGPADAYAYAKGKGLDMLMTSEHNHLFDGYASSTNGAANASDARARYQAGLNAAAAFNAKNPGFLALYGMEWGIIDNGGHMNIFGSKELFAWEYNNQNELIGDVLTKQTDYAGLYTLMKQKGLIGQFNHPTTSGQFKIGSKSLAYSADGDAVMMLCEVANASAFSNTTNESDTNIDTFEAACNKLLENGYHIAFASNQDNHCANWGASAPNRTGILLPNGTPLTNASFFDAVKARRVFATMDKNSQLVLTANGHIMGERFNNSGPLTLSVNFTNSKGKRVASVSLIEGVPGTSGSTALLSDQATVTITPTAGSHYYYAKVTQDDGQILWSAPIWVTQGAGSGTGGGTGGGTGSTGGGTGSSSELIVNGSFEGKTTGWSAATDVISNDATAAAHGGSYKAWLNGYGSAHTDTLSQTLTLPAATGSAQLSFWLKVTSDETVTTVVHDSLSVQLKNSSGKVLTTLGTFSNLDKGASYKKLSYDLSSYKGQSVQLVFTGVEDAAKLTSFLIDDVSLIVK